MRIVYRAQSLIDAHLVKDALEREEIPAFISGEYLTGAVGQLPAIDYVAVMVPEASAAIAEELPGPSVQSDDDWLAFVREYGETVFHPTSTCSIGRVVDERLRVMGIGGLRCRRAISTPR